MPRRLVRILLLSLCLLALLAFGQIQDAKSDPVLCEPSPSSSASARGAAACAEAASGRQKEKPGSKAIPRAGLSQGR